MKRAVALLTCFAAPAAAQDVQQCDWIARADAIVEPWEEHSRTFANGEVRIALLDVIEPAAGAFHLLVLSPPYAELGERQCVTLGMSNNIGFAHVAFSTLQAAYDPTTGLTFEIDVAVMDANGAPVPRHLSFSLNQSTGAIAAGLR